jgi:hypothetical protein
LRGRRALSRTPAEFLYFGCWAGDELVALRRRFRRAEFDRTVQEFGGAALQRGLLYVDNTYYRIEDSSPAAELQPTG